MDKNRRNPTMDKNRDLFAQLPIELVHIILSFLITEKKIRTLTFTGRFRDTKEAAQTIILSKRFLQAWSSFPNLYFTDVIFSQSLLRLPTNANQFQEASMAREKFANYVLQTVTGYQQQNIPITTLHLTARVQDYRHIGGLICFTASSHDDKIANILHQSISKAKENGVKEVYLNMVRLSPSNMLQTIFALKQLVSLILSYSDLVKKDFKDCDIVINCTSLRILKLKEVRINEVVLQKLINSCPLIERLKIASCRGLETIQIANLPYLKRLKVFTVKNQRVDINAESLELMIHNSFLNIESARNLKILKLKCACITDEHFHNLLAKCHVLEEITVQNCHKIQKMSISSQSLSFLSIIVCLDLMEVKIDAPALNLFEYSGISVLSSLVFANGGSGKRKSNVTLYLTNLEEASSFLDLSEFLVTLKHSDNISLKISSEEISFDRNTIDELRDENDKPEFEEVYIRVSSPSSTYSTLMEALLWSFSPKIISVKRDTKEDEEFIMYLCEELLVQHDDHPNISNKCWRNYFKQAKFKERDSEWRPLHSWKSLADVLENLGIHSVLKLSHD